MGYCSDKRAVLHYYNALYARTKQLALFCLNDGLAKFLDFFGVELIIQKLYFVLTLTNFIIMTTLKLSRLGELWLALNIRVLSQIQFILHFPCPFL